MGSVIKNFWSDFLSEGTIRNYLSAILDKLHLLYSTQLAIFYLKTKDAD